MMIAFDILKLDRLTDAQLFEFCMAVGADLENLCSYVKLLKSNIGEGEASFEGCWGTYNSNEMEKFKELVEYPAAVARLQQILKENPKKHFVSIAVSPSEVSYQIFNREDGIKHLIKHFGV
jgi:hypothetical protein